MIGEILVLFAGGCVGLLLAGIIYAASNHDDDRGD